jgi:L-alanine-DL-glutamate epimerase-like enolase superfamily enzyme
VQVIAATPPATCPMAEYLVRSQPAAQHFHTRPMQPELGAIALPAAPGLGLEIDDSKVDRRTDL